LKSQACRCVLSGQRMERLRGKARRRKLRARSGGPVTQGKKKKMKKRKKKEKKGNSSPSKRPL